MKIFRRVIEKYRERRGLPQIETLARDLAHGARMLIRRPAFALIATLTLAVGIGANTAIFSVVYGVVFRPLPYPDSSRVMTLWQNNLKAGAKEEVSIANFIDWRERARSFSGMGVLQPFSHELTGDGEPEVFRSWLVSEDFFAVMGTPPMLGRWFERADYQASPAERYPTGGASTVILSHALWQRRFASDPGMIGRKLLLRARPYTVVGVMPPEFDFPGADLWSPRIELPDDRKLRGSNYLLAVARLKPGVTVEIARQDFESVAAQLSSEYPRTNRDMGVLLVPLAEQLTGTARRGLFVLLGAVGLVLLVACANVANLTLARGAERERELAVRSALGASTVRLARQLVTENLLLAIIGGAAGVVLAAWSVRLLRAMNPGDLPRFDRIDLHWPVLAFALVVSLATPLVFGLVPAMRLARADRQDSLRGSRTTTASVSRTRLRGALVIAEIAVALALVAGAGLLGRSFAGLVAVDPGFRGDRVVSLSVHAWRRAPTPDQRRQFFEQTIEDMAALPGVESVAASSALPFHEDSIDMDAPFVIRGRPVQPGEETTAQHTTVTQDYFKTLAIPLRRGRFFNRSDGPETPRVVMINETMAKRYWPNENPLNSFIEIRVGLDKPGDFRIIGIVGDLRHQGLDRDPRPELFIAHPQNPSGSMTYVVRAARDPLPLVPALKQRIYAIKPDQPIGRIDAVPALLNDSLRGRRFQMILVAGFAGIALLLAAIGVYGLISYTTTERTAEFGVRIALGASRGEIFRLALGSAVMLAGAGVAIGIAAALGLTQTLKTMLFGIQPGDALTLGGAALVLAAVAMAAGIIPAMRATRVDPIASLRSE